LDWWFNNYQLPLTSYKLPITAAIIRAICVFDTKFDEFFRWQIHLSAYVGMSKKNYKNFDFCSQLSADLIENRAVSLRIC